MESQSQGKWKAVQFQYFKFWEIFVRFSTTKNEGAQTNFDFITFLVTTVTFLIVFVKCSSSRQFFRQKSANLMQSIENLIIQAIV